MEEKQYLVKDFLWIRKKGDSFEWGVKDQAYINKPEDFAKFFMDIDSIEKDDEGEIISKPTYFLASGAKVHANFTDRFYLSALIFENDKWCPIEINLSFDDMKRLPDVFNDYFTTGVFQEIVGSWPEEQECEEVIVSSDLYGLDSKFAKDSKKILNYEIPNTLEDPNNKEQPHSPMVKDVSLVEVKEPLPSDLSDLAKEMKDFLGTRVREKNDRFIS